jgi:hypothetical protein
VSRKSFLTSLIILVALAAGVGITLYVLLHHEPEAYVAAEVPPGPERESEADEFTGKALALYNQIQCATDWAGEFSEQQINSYLAEDFLKPAKRPFKLPVEIRDPRVVLRPGQLLVGFRYGDGELSTVISLQAKVWLPRREPNLIAIEIEQLRAGAMPVSVKSLQQQIDEAARKENIDVQWYRNEGNPVAIVRLQADRRDPSVILKDIEIRQGTLVVKGRTLDPEIKPSEPPTSGAKSTAKADPTP